MRVSDQQKRHRVAKISRCAFVAIALCGVATLVMADELIQTLPQSLGFCHGAQPDLGNRRQQTQEMRPRSTV